MTPMTPWIQEAGGIYIKTAGGASLAYIVTIFGVSLSSIEGEPVDRLASVFTGKQLCTVASHSTPLSNIKLVSLPDVEQTISNSFMANFFSVADSTKNPLARQRQYLKGHSLSRSQKVHFYALALAELGPTGTMQDYSMLMETAYNRGITEGDSDINQNLTRAYYQPLRKYAYKKYTVKIKVGKGKKRRTKKVKRTRRFTTRGYKNYLMYKRRLQASPLLYAKLDESHQAVLNGSNYSNFGTQNASAGVARSARKTQTITAETTTGETISRKDVGKYVKKHGYLTIMNTQKWVRRTAAQLQKYRELAQTPNQKSKPVQNIKQRYFKAVENAKSYLRTISVGGAAGVEGSGKIMRENGFDSIKHMNGPTAIRAAKALKAYNAYAKQNGMAKASLISAARFGHLHNMPGGYTDKTKSQHSAGLAIDITFGKGLSHANDSVEMFIFSKFGKAEGLYWGREIYGAHEGHHWQSHPGKNNVFRNIFQDGELTEAELNRILHADPFNPKGTLVVEQIDELMSATTVEGVRT